MLKQRVENEYPYGASDLALGMWHQNQAVRLQSRKIELRKTLDHIELDLSFYRHPLLHIAWDAWRENGVYPFGGGLFTQPAWVDKSFTYLSLQYEYSKIDKLIDEHMKNANDIARSVSGK